MKNQVYVCGTYYHLYIAMLWNKAHSEKGGKSLLVLQDFTTSLPDILPDVKKVGFFTHVIPAPFREKYSGKGTRYSRMKQNIRMNLLRTRSIIKKAEAGFDIVRYHDFIENSEINLFFNQGLCTSYFIVKYKHLFMRLLEDGERNYNSKLSNLAVFRKKYILRSFIGEGIDSSIKEIHVQNPERLSKRVRHKGVKLDLRKMVKNLSEGDRKKLVNFFLKDSDFDIQTSDNVLLITQPLSEDKYVTEDVKVALYEKILNDHTSNETIYIKVHPRERTDYKNKLGKPVHIIRKSFPVELFDLLPGIQFEKGITIYSSALNNLMCIKEKTFLTMHYDERLVVKKKFI